MAQEIPRKLQGALLRIRGDHPFLGTLALFAELRLTDRVPTAATDGKTLFFNPAYVEAQQAPALCGLLAHELLHAALLHVLRRRERDPHLWNIAADIVVNGMVRKETVYELPKGGVENPALAHLSVEEIYEQIRSGKLKVPVINLLDVMVPEQVDAGADGTGEVEGGSLGQTQIESLQRHWRTALHQAASVARRINKGFGRQGMDEVRDYEGATNPSRSWRELLWQFMVSTPYDFGGFDRRFIYRNLYLDDIVGESVDVTICIDTSGSIADPDLGEFLSEVQGVLDAYPHIRGHLFFADIALYGPHEFSKDVAMPQARGGGGTSFKPFFDWVRQREGTAPLCIYFTDGYGSFPATAPDASLMWVVRSGGLETSKFPFGSVVRLG